MTESVISEAGHMLRRGTLVACDLSVSAAAAK